jgi:tRNA(Arg) A34 adenosine deaminase TadA
MINGDVDIEDAFALLNRSIVRYAEQSTHPRHRHVALIFLEGILLASANNNVDNHAEARAIEVAKIVHGYIPDGCILVSIAITKAGKLKLAKPCKNCAIRIDNVGIKNVLYSTKEGRIVNAKNEVDKST